ncbi:MAG: DUF2939 domain-containing protein [Desulfarculus sp.]|nr:DUF2939 domain-containing protein [Pseudomonadota bacterium]MBV1716952.1 DUF2939 domain-containing protein [Desulfarculus sp.]MBU4573993.1 DUF2939 domain-containing protein [Pseudomonadota bacterium]MBU4597576.1 DUF2939 domain-containing protein [Pseudomonadota bacterium]MBV1736528.1 DUF2939 domain-containing protein [Desulfarculus sp.]
MRRWWLWVILAFLASGAFYATHSFLSGPRWALYQIGKSIHDREPRVFLAYVDIERILGGQKETIVDMVAPKGRRDDDTRSLVRGLVGAFMAPLSDQLAGQVVKAINDPERENLPSSWTLVFAANVTRNGNYALVVLSDPSKGQRLRLGMEKRKNGPWQVVDIDSNDLKRLAKKYLEERYGVKVDQKPAPQPEQTQSAPAPPEGPATQPPAQ